MNATPSTPAAPGAFPTTHWSVVLHAGAGSASQAQAALEELCLQYWYPLYAFARRQGRSHHDAEDCTQAFLARLLSTSGIARAEVERGRFRTFLLTAFRNFLTNEWHREHAVKRGGGQPPLPLPFENADERFVRDLAAPGLTPEQAFDHHWAVSLIDRSLGELQAEYERSGRGAVFSALSTLLWGDKPAGGVLEQANRLGIEAHALSTALYRMRQRFGQRLRSNVAATVERESDIESELRDLIAAIRGQ